MILSQSIAKTVIKASSLILSGATAVGLSGAALAHHHPTAHSSNDATSIFLPPTDETHTTSRAGGSRSAAGCRNDAETAILTAIAPQQQVGLTAAAHPTVLVYVPETSAQQLYFSVKTTSGQGHYETVLPLSQADSLVALALPTEAPPLAMGETYEWGVGLICPSGQTDMPWQQGQIKRVALPAALPNPPLERAAALGQLGLWYDTVTALTLARQNAPLSSPQQTNLLNSWAQILDWTGATAPATESILSTMR